MVKVIVELVAFRPPDESAVRLRALASHESTTENGLDGPKVKTSMCL